MMAYKKKKTSLPVNIVEDHNDVLYYIYRAIGSKSIPFNNGLMIHFDAHPDLVVPKSLNPERIYDKEYVLNSLSIENWIFPAIYAGHFDTVLWVKPPWSTQLENGLKKFKIGLDKSIDELKVSCGEPYFVSELSWSPEQDLRNPRDVTLQVCTLGDPLPPEGKETETSTAASSCTINSTLKDKLDVYPFVLDIDLDFYSTRNPFYALLTKDQFDLLRQLYHYEHPKSQSDEALLLATANRRKQLSELRSMLKDGFKPETETALSEAASALLDTFPNRTPPDPDLLHDAGCTCDDCDLPHHLSTPDQVRHLVAETESFLSLLPKPALVTIARSSLDDYCPPEDVDFIQELVLDMLRRIYGDELDIDKAYERDVLEEDPSTSKKESQS